jgi:hypothetical protein
MNTQPPSAAAGEHFADAERILAALPLVKRRAERDRRVQVALVHATLAIAVILADEDNHGRLCGRTHSARSGFIRAGRLLFVCAIYE